ncbi:hypothetical protein A6769_37240 [Nostoc punctiforme NIES-2108]|uniref:Uncharacterized protein n=1 Tax=Nostoc punctiforme NIES-2108 TaxID=1356359 RepID=A0A367S3E3_NOSPU|nr:hypothetical protein A6769_37240 [Nostoc punctiforme NIES-2108]
MTQVNCSTEVRERTEIIISSDMISLYEKQFSRQEVAKELNISVRTLTRYLEFAIGLIPDLSVYVDEFGTLNRRRIDSCHVEYLREVTDLLKNFSKERVISILTRKYSPIEND